jgi:hypothetical protein
MRNSLPALSNPARGGPSTVYVFPCAAEDLLKLGMSRDPLARMHALHPRFYEFFDCDRAFALQTERVEDARRIELQWGRELRTHRAPAPLTVAASAGGAREWYRGASGHLHQRAQAAQGGGHALIQPLSPWLQQRLLSQGANLFSWCALLSAAELDGRGAQARATVVQARVAEWLDAYLAFGLDLATWLPTTVLRWHDHASGRPALLLPPAAD